MPVIMEKGQKLGIDRSIREAHLGLSWDVKKTPGPAYDLDLFFVLVGVDGKAAYGDNENSMVYYRHKSNDNRSVYVLEDNLTGEGDGFDEEGFIILANVPAEVKEIVAAISIYDYATRRQNFGQVANAGYTILNKDSGEVIATGDLSEDMSNYTGISVCKFRREADNTWSVKAIMEPVPNGMTGIISQYGMN